MMRLEKEKTINIKKNFLIVEKIQALICFFVEKPNKHSKNCKQQQSFVSNKFWSSTL